MIVPEATTLAQKNGLVCSLGTYGHSDHRSLQVSQGPTKNVMSITFERTLRVPDNKDVNFLPPSLGQFPLFSVAQYKHRLPQDMAAKGGVFLPMMQREAMWMKFSAQRPFAMKIYVGGVNAISGVPISETPEAALKRLQSSAKVKQDYVVLPDQPWLDGIAAEDGQIRQFVAMPKGSGYSVEVQVTGEEKIDGIQFEIIPPKLGCHDVLKIRYSSQTGTNLNKTMQLGRVINPDSTVLDLKKLAAQEFGLEITDQTFTLTNENNLGSISFNGSENSKILSEMYFSPNATLDIREVQKIRAPSAPLASRFRSMGMSAPLSMDHLDYQSEPLAKNGGFLGFGRGGGAVGAVSSSFLSKKSKSKPSADFGPPGGESHDDGFAVPSSVMAVEKSAEPYQSYDYTPEASSFGLNEEGGKADRRRSSPSGSAAPPPPPAPIPDIKAMSLAAGGLIKQSINADNYPSTLWNPEGTIFFNVQLLNSEAFTAVTGHAPPETPIDAKTYAAHNMPFFDIWNEEKSGVKGDFGMVKSIGEMDATKALEKNEFWAKMKGETGSEGTENVVGFERDESLEFPVVMLDMSHKRTFKPLTEMEEEMKKMKLEA